MDLNIINNQVADSMDLFTKKGDISDLEAMDTLDILDDKDISLEPESFVLLFADLMQKNPLQDEIKSEVSDTDTVTVTETQTDVKVQLPVDTLNANEKTVSDNEPQLSDDSNLSDDVDLRTTPDSILNLENNVAMAWINSENFQPPQTTPTDNELNDELTFELDSELVQPEALINQILKKDVNSADEEAIKNLLKNEVELPGDLINKSLKESNLPVDELVDDSNDVTPNVNFKEDILKSFKLAETESPVTTAELNIPVLRQNIQTAEPTLENIQNIVQSNNVSMNNDQPNTNTVPVLKSLEIPVDINNPQWADKFSQQIIWLGNQNIKSALIKIHPEDLGPLEISINVVKDSATVTINTQSSAAHALIDQSIPKLREMMAEQGLNLSEVNIGTETNSRQSGQNSKSEQDTFNINAEEEISFTPLDKKISKGLIDYFA